MPSRRGRRVIAFQHRRRHEAKNAQTIADLEKRVESLKRIARGEKSEERRQDLFERINYYRLRISKLRGGHA